jgi:hypothetical protein
MNLKTTMVVDQPAEAREEIYNLNRLQKCEENDGGVLQTNMATRLLPDTVPLMGEGGKGGREEASETKHDDVDVDRSSAAASQLEYEVLCFL